MLISGMRRALARALWPDPTARLDDVVRELAALRHTVSALEYGIPAALIPPRELLALPRDKAESLCRAHVRPFYLGDHRALSTILARYSFFSDTRDVGFGTHMLTGGFWEMWLTAFIARTVQEGMFVLDVGANFGYYSVLMADLIGPNGKLLAFEPNPHAASSAEASLLVNGFEARSTVVHSAASDIARRVAFAIPHHEPKNARMVPDGYTSDGEAIIQVSTVTVDEVCRRERKVDFIKIDAEGGEYKIFQGMQKLIVRDRPVIVLEFNAARDSSDALLDLILRTYGAPRYLGYDSFPYDVSPDRLMSENVGEDWLLLLE
jgi:FkbM family methyltransferase